MTGVSGHVVSDSKIYEVWLSNMSEIQAPLSLHESLGLRWKTIDADFCFDVAPARGGIGTEIILIVPQRKNHQKELLFPSDSVLKDSQASCFWECAAL